MPDNKPYIDTLDYTPSKRYSTSYDKELQSLRQPITIDASKSKYDEGQLFNVNDPVNTLIEHRGEEQSGVTKLGTGLLKAAVITGTTAADGLIGTAVGIGNMTGKGKFSAFWDNPFSNYMNDINQKAEEWFPTYQSKSDKEASFLGQLGTSYFWGNQFIKNIGFTAGMLIDGVLTGGASEAMLGSKALAAKLPSAIANILEKEGAAGVNRLIATGKSAELTNEVIKNARQLTFNNRVSQGLGLAMSTQAEARNEAISNSTDFYNRNKQVLDQNLAEGKITEDDYNNKLIKLQDAKEGMGNADFAANLAILGVSNAVQFKNLFTRGFNANKQIANGVEGSIAQGYKATKNTALDAAKIAKNIAAEGVWEEQGQYAAQQAADDYYQRKFDGKATGKVDDIFHSFYKGLSDAYGTREGWDQGLVGSLTGLIGLPTIRRDESGNPTVTMASGIWNDIKEVKEGNQYNQRAADNLNTLINSPTFKNNYDGLIRNISLEDAKQRAAANNDKYGVLNAEHDQLINDALTFTRAGKFEDYLDNISAIKNSNAEEVKSLFKQADSDVVNANTTESDLPVEGNPYNDIFKGLTSEQIVDKLNTNADSMTKYAKSINKLYNAYSTQYPNISEDTKDKLIYTASKLDNINDRLNSIDSEVSKAAGVNVNNYIVDDKFDAPNYFKEVDNNLKTNLVSGRISTDTYTNALNSVVDVPKLVSDKREFVSDYLRFLSSDNVQKEDNKTKQQNTAKTEEQQTSNVNKIKEETKPYIPSEGDYVHHKDADSNEEGLYKVDSYNEDGSANIAPVDDKGAVVGESKVAQPESIALVSKKGGLEGQGSTETVNDTEVPTEYKKYSGEAKKPLKSPASSISTSHYDPSQGETVVRNEKHDEYISDPKNDLTNDEVNMSIDTSSDDGGRRDKIWGIHKAIKDKLDKGEYLTEDQAAALVNDRRLSKGEDLFTSPVDILPIKTEHVTKAGEKYNEGLFMHDPNYITRDTISLPIKELTAKAKEQGRSLDDVIDDFITGKREELREARKFILYNLLQGKQVVFRHTDKSKGIPNNIEGATNKISDVLKINANQVILGIADSKGIYTGEAKAPMDGHGSQGNVYFTTDKTCNGETATLKANVSKLSKEHAEIVFKAILQGHKIGNKGRHTIYEGSEVNGLTVQETIDMLTNYGSDTDLNKPDNNLPTYLVDKQLFVNPALVLTYGVNSLNLKDLYNNRLDYETELSKFIDWAATYKNYAVRKYYRPLGIAINEPMKRKFKIGSFVSDGNDTYTGFLVKNNIVTTDVEEFKNTGSLFHAPVIMFDLSKPAIELKKVPELVKQTNNTTKEVTKQASNPTSKPEITGTIDIPATNRYDLKKVTGNVLKSLPVNAVVYKETIELDNDENGTSVIKPMFTISLDNGKKVLTDVAPIVSKTLGGDTRLSNGTYSILANLLNKMTAFADTSKSVIANEEVTPTTEEQELDLDGPIDVDIDFGQERPLFHLKSKEEYIKFNKDKELKWLNDNLSNVPTNVQEGLIYVANQGKYAFGQFKANAITLSNVAEQGTAYHEAYHTISLMYLPDEVRQSIYDEGRTKFNISGSDRDIEEELAEQFRMYQIERDANKPTTLSGKILDWFQQLYTIVKQLFTGKQKLTDMNIDSLFNAISSGYFKNYNPIKENIDKLGTNTYELTYRNTKLVNVKNYRDFKQIVRGLSSSAMTGVREKVFASGKASKYATIDIKNSIQDADFEAPRKALQSKVDDMKRALSVNSNVISTIQKGNYNQELADKMKKMYNASTVIPGVLNAATERVNKYTNLTNLYQEVLDNYDNIYKPAMVDWIRNSLNIKSKVEDQDQDQEDIQINNIINDAADYEFDAKDNLRGSIKFLISNLYESNDVNPTTGLRHFVDTGEVWNRLSTELYNIDTVEEMIDKLAANEGYYPYQQLAQKLKDSSEIVRSQFQNSFKMHRHNFVNGLASFQYDEDGKIIGASIRMSNADINTIANQKVAEWNNNAVSSILFNKDKVDINKFNNLVSEFKTLSNDYKYDLGSGKPVDTNLYKDNLVGLLGNLSINIDRSTIDIMCNNIISKTEGISTEDKALDKVVSNISPLFSNYSILSKSAKAEKLLQDDRKKDIQASQLFKHENVIKSIAEAYAQANPDEFNNSVPGADGNTHHKMSLPTYMTDRVKQIKGDEEFINHLLSDSYKSGSYYLKLLRDNKAVRDNFDIVTYNSTVMEDTGDTGRDYLNISPTEDFLYKLSAIRDGYTINPTLADRKTYTYFTGLPNINFRYQMKDGEYIIPDHIIDIFYDYAVAEHNRIKSAEDLLKQACKLVDGNLVDDKGKVVKNLHSNDKVIDKPWLLVDNYHYVKDGKTYNTAKGNAFKYQLFSSFNKEGFDFDRDVRKEIRKTLRDSIQETVNKARDLGVISSTNNNLLLDANHIEAVAREYNGDQKLAIASILGEFTINTMVSTIEGTMMFSGDPAFYKADSYGDTWDDLVKRLSVLTSSGSKLREIVPGDFNETTYNVIGLNRQRFQSTYYQNIKDKQTELLKKKYSNLSDEQIKKIVDTNLDDYNKIDPTDAEVFISPEMSRSIDIREGDWSDEKEAAYRLLESDKELTTEEEQQALNVVLQPKKYVYFDELTQEISEDNNLLIPTYDKMSLATVFRRFAKGTYMEDLLDRMELKGDYAPGAKYNPNGSLQKIHLAKYETAVKAGNRERVNLIDNINTAEQQTANLGEVHTYSQNFSMLRKQVVTDPHHTLDTLLASQVKKVAQANVIKDADYNINGKNVKGQEVIDNINLALSILSDKGIMNTLDKLGVNPETGLMDDKLFYDILLKESQKAGMPEPVQEALRLGLQIDSLPDRKWIYSRFISLLNKSAIDSTLPGNQLIQMTGFGLGKKGLNDYKDKTNNLRFIFDDKGKISGCEAMVSVQLFRNVIPNYESKSFQEKVDWLKNNKGVLEGLGYRIPTQGQNSTIPITVVDFLPENVGDVIVLPNEHTALTGSDFDIDKLFFVRYNYYTDKEGNAIKTPFLTDDNSTAEERYDNYIMEAFYSNRNVFDKDSYDALSEAKTALFNAVQTKADLIGDIGSTLKALKQQRKVLLDQINETKDDLKDLHREELTSIDGKIFDIVQQENLVNESRDNLKEYKSLIKEALTKNKLIVSLDEFKELPLIQQNNTKAIQNHLLDNYRGILLSENNFMDTSSPLGVITSLLKKLSDKVTIAEEGLTEEEYKKAKKARPSLSHTTPSYQSDVKFKYTGGKKGVGPSALNNVHHILCQIANVSYKGYIGVGLKDEQDNTYLGGLDTIPDNNGYSTSIMSWLSALIDAHVDIAKDPYIINLNVTDKTYNVAFLLTRVGLGEKVFHFLPQPILKDLSNEAIKEKGKIKIKSDKKPLTIIREKYKKEFERLGGKYLTKYKIEEIFNWDLLKLIETPKNNRNKDWYDKQLSILNVFNDLDKGVAKDLGALVMASRVDTKKYGKNLSEVKVYMDSVKQVVKDNKFTNIDKLLGYNIDENTAEYSKGATFIPSYMNNGPLMAQALFSNQTVTGTKYFNDLIDKVLSYSKLLENTDNVNKVADALYSSIVGKFFTDKEYLGLTKESAKFVINRTIHTLKNINTNPKFADVKDNPLVKNLVKGLYTDDKLSDILGFTGIPVIKTDDNLVKEDMIFGWQDLLEHPDTEIQNFAKELFIYSFYTSGFKRGLFSLHGFIPPMMMKEMSTKNGNISFNEYIKDTITVLNDKDATESYFNDILDDIYRNNSDDIKLVPNVNELKPYIVSKKKDRSTVLYSFADKDGKYSLGLNSLNQDVYIPYTTYKLGDTKYLGQYIGTKGGNPIYKVVNKKGYQTKGRKIVEYGLEGNTSMLEINDFGELSDETVLKYVQGIDYVKPEDRTTEISPIVELSDESDTDISDEDRSLNVEAESAIKSSVGFQGYKGGFENKGKGTPEGDGKDKAMREVATGFIGEVVDRKSSTYTSASTIGKKTKQGVIPEEGSYTINSGFTEKGSIIMLARNGKFRGRDLEFSTKRDIKNANMYGAEFVVGDMPGVDSQFIDYLQEIGAKFTIYHTDNTSRITISDKAGVPESTITKQSIINDINDMDYSDSEKQTMIDIVNETEVNNEKDMNDLINKLCSGLSSKGKKVTYSKSNNKFTINK